MNVSEIKEKWGKVKKRIREENRSLYAVIVDVYPFLESESLIVLYVKPGFQFHLKQIINNAEYIKQIIKQIFKNPSMQVDVDFQSQQQVKDKIVEHKEFVKQVVDLFDGKCKIVSQKLARY